MILLIRKKRLFAALILGLLLIFGAPFLLRSRVPAFSANCAEEPTIVIDPGHGGEDGGAVSKEGVVESGINLAIGQKLCALLEFLGREPRMTRTTDISIYTQGAQTLRQKKVSDLKNRVALINALPNALLVSIHQNSMPTAPSTHGASVFYGKVEGSRELAATVQDCLNRTINGERGKTIKAISPSIYLMKNVTTPAILVECGFLSHAKETAQLQDAGYQTRLALTLAAGILMDCSK